MCTAEPTDDENMHNVGVARIDREGVAIHQPSAHKFQKNAKILHFLIISFLHFSTDKKFAFLLSIVYYQNCILFV
jgi:hypothetical protein